LERALERLSVDESGDAKLVPLENRDKVRHVRIADKVVKWWPQAAIVAVTLFVFISGVAEDAIKIPVLGWILVPVLVFGVGIIFVAVFYLAMVCLEKLHGHLAGRLIIALVMAVFVPSLDKMIGALGILLMYGILLAYVVDGKNLVAKIKEKME